MYEKIIWVVARFKSFFKGFGEGFYGDPNYLQSENCMDDDTIESIYNIFMGFRTSNGWIDKTFRVMSSFSTF